MMKVWIQLDEYEPAQVTVSSDGNVDDLIQAAFLRYGLTCKNAAAYYSGEKLRPDKIVKEVNQTSAEMPIVIKLIQSKGKPEGAGSSELLSNEPVKAYFNAVKGVMALSASQFGKKWRETQEDLKEFAHLCHRPSDKHGTHVSLHFKVFDDFVVNCQEIVVDSRDVILTEYLMSRCSEGFPLEKNKLSELQEALSSYFDLSIAPRIYNNGSCSDGCIHFMKGRDTADALILEVKSELTGISSDPYMQAIAYYYNNIIDVKNEELTSCKLPCFLVEIFGTYVVISGAIFNGQSILVDQLVVRSLLYQRNDKPFMMATVRALKALNMALHALKEYYQNFTAPDSDAERIHMMKVPFPLHNSHLKFRNVVKEPNCEVYCATAEINGGDKQVIVKFTDKYCSEAHGLLASKGFAPELLAKPVKVTSRHIMVIMEYIENATNLHDFLKDHQAMKEQLKECCRKALEILHGSSFCHGDFRSTNILVLPLNAAEDKLNIKIIDFDWSGKEDVDKYPYFMNHVELKWPDTASDGNVLSCEHDLYWLSKNFLDDALRHSSPRNIVYEVLKK